MPHGMPSLDELGRDLLRVSAARKAIGLAFPFVVAALFFVFAARGWWIPAIVCTMVLSFITYGSVSHDLVHRNIDLPPWLNEPLLAAIELLAFRSGHAYRWTHLRHHGIAAAAPSMSSSDGKRAW